MTAPSLANRFAAAWAVNEVVSLVLEYFDLPRLAQVGIGLGLTGAVFVLASLILERIADARAEGDLMK